MTIKSLVTNPGFKYTPAAKTDIRKTFAKARREIEQAAEKAKAGQVPRLVQFMGRKP